LTTHPRPLQTRRLLLLPLDGAAMTALIDGDAPAVTAAIGAFERSDWCDAIAMLRQRRRGLAADPSFAPWVPRAIIRRADGAVIGHMNFHSAPDPDYLRPHASGAVEAGYTIFERYRRRGYAREALLALLGWARSAHGVTRLALSIGAANLPSRIMAEQLGLTPVAVWQHDADGAEVIYAGPAPSVRPDDADH
jgi:RimJ/RimL family protein N-acetyltransferase